MKSIMSSVNGAGKANGWLSVGFVLGMLLLSFSAGCASHQEGKLQLISLDQRRDFSATFSEAYISRTTTGDWDIMLVQDGVDTKQHNDPDKPLRPEERAVPRQYVHVRVFWKTLGQKADHPASTNASVQWCLLGDGPDAGSLLEYGGSGLVILSDSKDGAGVTIRTAWMKAVNQRGSMVDPLGPSRMQGTVHAIADNDRVNALLAEMKAEMGATEVRADGVGQPERLSINP